MASPASLGTRTPRLHRNTIVQTRRREEPQNMDLEEIWRIREKDVYPKLFGPNGRGIFTLSAELFTGTFRQTEIDPLWLFYGVYEFAPTQDRPSWLYVT
jgi:hypothetical protein